MKPGIHELSASEYHADPCEQPSLSASVAHVLTSKSPLHAWARHPRLNPDFERKESDTFDLGRAVHAYLLEGRAPEVLVDEKDWKKKAAQEAKAQAREEGKTAMLKHQWEDTQRMAASVNEQLEERGFVGFANGHVEQTLCWEEDGVWCRSRLDWFGPDRALILDVKSTSQSAHHRAYERRLFGMGGDIQAAMYLRGLAAVTGSSRWATFRWIVCEVDPPFAVSVIQPAADILELGGRKVDYAIDAWRRCLADDEWPGYSTEIEYAHAPEYEIAKWLEREAEAQAVAA